MDKKELNKKAGKRANKKICAFSELMIVLLVFFPLLVIICTQASSALNVYIEKEGYGPVISSSGDEQAQVSCYTLQGKLKCECAEPGKYYAVAESDGGSGTFREGTCIAAVSSGTHKTIKCLLMELTAESNSQSCQQAINQECNTATPLVWLESGPQGNKCCGDVDSDMTVQSSDGTYICGKNSASRPEWLHKTQYKGKIFEMPFNDYLSDGNKWISCKGAINPLNIGQTMSVIDGATTTGYICYPATVEGSTQYRFAKCCGIGSLASCQLAITASTAQATIIERRKLAGAKVTAGNKEYWCASDLEGNTFWTNDLSQDPSGESCQSSGFYWTGTKCCGDMFAEYYNDEVIENISVRPTKPAGADFGGCFNSVLINTNTLVSSVNIIKAGSFELSAVELFEGETPLWIKLDNEIPKIMLQNGLHVIAKSDLPIRGVYQEIQKHVRPGAEYMLSGNITPALSSGEAIIGIGTSATTLLISKRIEKSNTVQEFEFNITIPMQTENLKLFLLISNSQGGRAVFSNVALKFKNNRILNSAGTFYSCNSGSPGQYISGFDDTTNPGNNNDLILDTGMCFAKGSYYCSETGWSNEPYPSDTDNNGVLIPLYNPDGTRIESMWKPAGERTQYVPGVPEYTSNSRGCCPNNYCWNGTLCIKDQSNEPMSKVMLIGQETDQPDQKSYFCKNITWRPVQWKYDIAGRKGYCPDPGLCLVDATKNDGTGCIGNGQSYGNVYCENGTTVSKTKYVALQLLDFVKNNNYNDYSTYCGNYKSVLNDLDTYSVMSSAGISYSVDMYIEGNEGGRSVCSPLPTCVNTFCALSYDHDKDQKTPDKLIIGTSLNQGITADKFSFLDLIDMRGCADTFSKLNNTDPNLAQCKYNNAILYYLPEHKLVFFSKHEFEFKEATKFNEVFMTYLKNPVKAITDLIGVVIRPLHPATASSLNYDFVSRTALFDNVFIANKGNLRILGIKEQVGDATYLSINYSGINADICKSIKIADTAKYGNLNLLSCGQLNGKFYVVARDTPGGAGGIAAWDDLTSKLRTAQVTEEVNKCIGNYPAKCSEASNETTIACGKDQRCEGTLINACDTGIGTAAKCCKGTCTKITMTATTGALADEQEQQEQQIKCIPAWTCQKWGACTDGVMKCTQPIDLNTCGIAYAESPITILCGVVTKLGETPVQLKCSDGTIYNKCSGDLPKKCENGQLINKCSECGCPPQYMCSNDGSCLKPCSTDGTLSGKCSLNKPQKCEDGLLVNKCSECGCPSEKTCKTDGSCVTKCSDGTIDSQCSTNKPKKCENGNLINKCSECGCPSGKTCQTDGSCVTKCSDGTIAGQCSTNKPLKCDENGRLGNLCSECGCPSDRVCESDGSCVVKSCGGWGQTCPYGYTCVSERCQK